MESVQRGVSVLWLRSSGGPRDVVDVNISPASALKTVPAVPIAPADTHTPQGPPASHICSVYGVMITLQLFVFHGREEAVVAAPLAGKCDLNLTCEILDVWCKYVNKH